MIPPTNEMCDCNLLSTGWELNAIKTNKHINMGDDMGHTSGLNDPHQASHSIHIWQQQKNDFISDVTVSWELLLLFDDYKGLIKDVLSELFFVRLKII